MSQQLTAHLLSNLQKLHVDSMIPIDDYANQIKNLVLNPMYLPVWHNYVPDDIALINKCISYIPLCIRDDLLNVLISAEIIANTSLINDFNDAHHLILLRRYNDRDQSLIIRAIFDKRELEFSCMSPELLEYIMIIAL